MEQIGLLIDELQKNREARQALEDQIKELNKSKADTEAKLIQLMEENKLEKAAGKLATCTYKVDLYPGCEDKEVFYRWVVANEAFEFVQARVNAGPVREMFEQKNAIPPGVNTFTKPVINLRAKR